MSLGVVPARVPVARVLWRERLLGTYFEADQTLLVPRFVETNVRAVAHVEDCLKGMHRPLEHQEVGARGP